MKVLYANMEHAYDSPELRVLQYAEEHVCRLM